MGFRQAFALSKSEVRDATPPGTTVLIDNELVRTETGHHEHSEKHIHLQPEPSADPADPLNFARWRKIVILALMCIYAFIANTQSSILSSALSTLVTAFVTGPPAPGATTPQGFVPFTDLTHLLAVNILTLGAANIFIVPLSNTFGRRPLILFSLLALTVFSVWAAEAKTFNSLLAARVFTGIGGSAADTLAPDIVGHIFFVHERGRAMALYTVFLITGSLVGGTIGGYVTSDLGWRWTMWLHVILAGGTFVLCVLLLPETLFDRKAALSVLQSDSDSEKHTKTDQVERVNSQVYPPFTFGRSLGFMKPRKGFFVRFFTPFLTVRLPGCLMVMLHYAGLVGLIVSISTIAPQIMAEPPYLWGAGSGLINIGALVGAILGAAYTYLTADWLTKRNARKESHGFAEPEGRLPLMFPALIISFGGALVFGFVAQNPSPKGWVGLAFGFGMVAFGLMQIPSIGFNYIIEAYGPWSSECFLIVTVFRSIIAFAWTFFVGDWVASKGAAEPFGIFAMLMGLFALTVLPVWLYGKRMRIATADWVRQDKIH